MRYPRISSLKGVEAFRMHISDLGINLKCDDEIITGSDRMKERPIKPLVDALRRLGAKIDYLAQEGFPPLRISAKKNELQAQSIS